MRNSRSNFSLSGPFAFYSIGFCPCERAAPIIKNNCLSFFNQHTHVCAGAFKFFIIVFVDVVRMMHVRNIACSFDRTERLLAALMISADEIHLHRVFFLVCASFVSTNFSIRRHFATYYVCVLCAVCIRSKWNWMEINHFRYSIWSTNRINCGRGVHSLNFESNNTFAVGRLLNGIVH